ncbi:MAG: hypothetical protein Q8P18_19260 [Pseudomonadota bacterium]|nr:hypothetical protein [Pseudomonadota bacterium]
MPTPKPLPAPQILDRFVLLHEQMVASIRALEQVEATSKDTRCKEALTQARASLLRITATVDAGTRRLPQDVPVPAPQVSGYSAYSFEA